MKTRKRELAKPGIYGTVDNPVVVSRRDLMEIAETFPEIKKAPVSLNGHWPDPAKPRMGNVVAVTFDETTSTLFGDVEEQDVLAKAVDDGFFPDVSIGAKRRASDGKMYLHHLAYLGEMPPAIKNLISDISDSLTDPNFESLAASDSADVFRLPSVQAERLNLSDPAGQSPAGSDKSEEEEESMTLEEALAKLKEAEEKNTALTAENEKYQGQLKELAEKYPDSGISLSDSDPRVGKLMGELKAGKKAALLKSAEGKFPKAKEPLLVALADSMSATSSIELSDGEEKKNLSQMDLLKNVFEAMPSPVSEGRLDLSDEGSGEDQEPIDMNALMSRV